MCYYFYSWGQKSLLYYLYTWDCCFAKAITTMALKLLIKTRNFYASLEPFWSFCEFYRFLCFRSATFKESKLQNQNKTNILEENCWGSNYWLKKETCWYVEAYLKPRRVCIDFCVVQSPSPYYTTCTRGIVALQKLLQQWRSKCWLKQATFCEFGAFLKLLRVCIDFCVFAAQLSKKTNCKTKAKPTY